VVLLVRAANVRTTESVSYRRKMSAARIPED
jgi:hypothetical protein